MKAIAIVAMLVVFVVAVGGCGRTKKDDEEAEARADELRAATEAAAEEARARADEELARAEADAAQAKAEEAASEAEAGQGGPERAEGEAEDTGLAAEETERQAAADAEAEEAEASAEAAEAEAEETTVVAEETAPELEEITLTEADDGEEIELTLGQVLVVTLASDQTTEFRWEVAPFVEPVVKRVGELEYAPSEPEGTDGKTTLRFKAVSTGRAPLHMIYQRPGERNPQPAKKFTVKLVVR